MKYRKLFVSGLAFLAAILLIVCGIFVPTVLLQAQENRILNSQYACLIDTRELESSDTAIGIANADPEYLELLYRLRMTNDTSDYTTLEESGENELSRDAAIEKAKQELLRLMDLGACPRLDGLDDYVVDQAFLLGHDESRPDLRENVLEGMKAWGYDISELSQIDQRVCVWRITFKHKTEKAREIQVRLDAQTGKVYLCQIVSNDLTEEMLADAYINETYALMFGKYHNLGYSPSDSYNDGGYYNRFSTCRFDEISIWASFDVYFGESNEPEGWNFSCVVQPAYHY